MRENLLEDWSSFPPVDFQGFREQVPRDTGAFLTACGAWTLYWDICDSIYFICICQWKLSEFAMCYRNQSAQKDGKHKRKFSFAAENK